MRSGGLYAAIKQQYKPAGLTALWRQSRSLFIRTMTVGPGITPGLLTLAGHQPKLKDLPSARGLCALRAITAGGELHPALRTLPPAFLAADILYHNFFANAWLLFANSYQIFCCVISAILGKPLNMTNPSCSTLVRKGIPRLASRADHLLPRPLP